MSTDLTIISALTLYLCVAGYVHFDTQKPRYDPSRLRRIVKIVILAPAILVLLTIFIVRVVIVEVWEDFNSERRLRKTILNAQEKGWIS